LSPSLVIFDCDGVLVDSEVIFNQVLVTDLNSRGLEIQHEEALDLFVGGSLQSLVGEVESKGVALGDGWVEQLYEKVLNRLREGVDPVPGIHDLLMRLSSAQIPFCVASNGPVAKMHVTLGQNDLLPHFENALFSAYEVEIWKPEPGLFLHAAEQFSIAPEDCVVIEDSTNGTLAAQRAGMACFAYAPEEHKHRVQLNGGTRFSHMNEIPKLLNL